MSAPKTKDIWLLGLLLVLAATVLFIDIPATLVATMLSASDVLDLTKAELQHWVEISALVRNFGLFLIAIPALWLAWNRTRTASKQAQISESGLIIDRFQKGAQMLESDELSVRLAGIYALRELVWSDPGETYFIVLDLLFDFVRERSKERKADYSKVSKRRPRPSYSALPPDVQKALETAIRLRRTVINARKEERRKKWNPDLSNANLSEANLSGVKLPEVNLSYADMSGAKLHGANLSNANLRKADLSGATMLDANLSGARLSDANLSGAFLTTADLSNVKLFFTNLHGAFLSGANLSNARLYETNLCNVLLSNANLFNTNLYLADLSLADLSGANLSNARLSGANLTEASVTAFWAWKSAPPSFTDFEVAASFALRKRKEPWSDFVTRTMRESPDLGWTEDMIRNPYL